MLIRRKSIRDEYQDMVEAELAKKEADLKSLAEAAASEVKAAKVEKPKKKKVGGLKTKK